MAAHDTARFEACRFRAMCGSGRRLCRPSGGNRLAAALRQAGYEGPFLFEAGRSKYRAAIAA